MDEHIVGGFLRLKTLGSIIKMYFNVLKYIFRVEPVTLGWKLGTTWVWMGVTWSGCNPKTGLSA